MNQTEMKRRTKEFAKEIIILCRKLPNNREGRLIGDQIFRSGTSVAANYRSACRARSKAEFISRLSVVEEEAADPSIGLTTQQVGQTTRSAVSMQYNGMVQQSQEATVTRPSNTASQVSTAPTKGNEIPGDTSSTGPGLGRGGAAGCCGGAAYWLLLLLLLL